MKALLEGKDYFLENNIIVLFFAALGSYITMILAWIGLYLFITVKV